MPYLIDEYSKLSQNDKVAGIVATFHQLGFQTLVPKLPFKMTIGSQHEYQIEAKRTDGRVTHKPNSSNDVQETSYEHEVIQISCGHLAVDAPTSIYQQSVESDLSDIHRVREYQGAKDLAFEFGEQLFHGSGASEALNGADYFLQRFGGYVAADGSVSRADGISAQSPLFDGRQIWYTDDFSTENGTGTPGAAAKSLDLNIIDDLVTRDDGQGFDCLVGDRQSYLWVYQLMRQASGGMVPPHMEDPNFGRPVLHYFGTPIIWSNQLAREKEGKAGAYGASVSGTTLTVEQPAGKDDWIGFTSFDVGRTVELDNGTDAAEQHEIASITDARTVELASTPSAASGYTNSYFKVMPSHAFYAFKFGEVDGFSAIFSNVNDLSSDQPTSPGYTNTSSIAGFSAKFIGRDHSQTRHINTQMDWIGTFRSGSIWALARLQGYTNPA